MQKKPSNVLGASIRQHKNTFFILRQIHSVISQRSIDHLLTISNFSIEIDLLEAVFTRVQLTEINFGGNNSNEGGLIKPPTSKEPLKKKKGMSEYPPLENHHQQSTTIDVGRIETTASQFEEITGIDSPLPSANSHNLRKALGEFIADTIDRAIVNAEQTTSHEKTKTLHYSNKEIDSNASLLRGREDGDSIAASDNDDDVEGSVEADAEKPDREGHV